MNDEAVTERLAATLDAHVTGAEPIGERQMRLACACGEWADDVAVLDSPSLAWAEAHARWRTHRAATLLPVVCEIAAEELRAAAAALSRPSEGAAYEVWAHGGGDWLRARADAITERTP